MELKKIIEIINGELYNKEASLSIEVEGGVVPTS